MDKDLHHLKVTGIFDTNKFEDFLLSLKNVYNIKIEKRKQTVYLYKK